MVNVMIRENLPSRDIIKERVKAFWNKGKNKEITKLTISSMYEFAAKLYGYENWDTFSAILEKNDESIARRKINGF